MMPLLSMHGSVRGFPGDVRASLGWPPATRSSTDRALGSGPGGSRGGTCRVGDEADSDGERRSVRVRVGPAPAGFDNR